MVRGLIKCLESQSGQPFEKRQLQTQKRVLPVKKLLKIKVEGSVLMSLIDFHQFFDLWDAFLVLELSFLKTLS